MQDWAYEVADPKRLAEFFGALDRYELEPDVKFTLMDIIFQSLEESKVDLLNSEIVCGIKTYLKKNYSIHIYQIWYWSSFDSELTDGFRISPLLRKIWSDENI